MIEKPNYQTLIDQEVWDFIEQSEQWYPADAVTQSIAEQRTTYQHMCRAFDNGYPVGVNSIDDVIASAEQAVPVRRYTTKPLNDCAHIIYVHGGGYVLGDLDSHDSVCADICRDTGLGLTSIDYRLSPENKHPAAFADCVAVVVFEAARLQRPLLLCGDSAGGNLCAAVAHHLRNTCDTSPVIAQILIYPELGGDSAAGSYLAHAHAPMLTRDDIDFYMNIRVQVTPPVNDATFAPLHDTDFSNLPTTLVLSAECDPLADDGKHYCDAINRAGGTAQWRCETGLVHGYLRARFSSSRAKASFDYMTNRLREIALNS